MTTYEAYYITGKDDRKNNMKMMHPSSLIEGHAFRGYVDGWSGREFSEPVGMQIKHKPRVTIN
jgi:hypothetical protein